MKTVYTNVRFLPPPPPFFGCASPRTRYCLSALNTALVTGDSGNPTECFDGQDTTCPKGSALRDLELPTVQQELATSLLIAGAWVGSMLAGKLSDALGRRSVDLFFPRFDLANRVTGLTLRSISLAQPSITVCPINAFVVARVWYLRGASSLWLFRRRFCPGVHYVFRDPTHAVAVERASLICMRPLLLCYNLCL